MNESGKEEGIYSYDIPAPYPYTSAYGKQPLIAISETYMDGKQVDGQHYYYEGGIQHLTGMGFCGFTQTRTVDFKGKEGCVNMTMKTMAYWNMNTTKAFLNLIITTKSSNTLTEWWKLT